MDDKTHVSLATRPGSTSSSLSRRAAHTLLTMCHIFATAEARDANIAAYGSVQGVIDTTNRLADYLLGMPAEAAQGSTA